MSPMPARNLHLRCNPIGEWLAVGLKLHAIRSALSELHHTSLSPVERGLLSHAVRWLDDSTAALQEVVDAQHPGLASGDFPLLQLVGGLPPKWPTRDALPDAQTLSAAERQRSLEAACREIGRISRWLESVPGDPGPTLARLNRAREFVLDVIGR